MKTKKQQTTIDSAVKRYIPHLKGRNLSYHHTRILLGRIKTFVKAFGDRTFDSIQKEELEKYIRKMGSPVSQRHHLFAVQSVFKWAKDCDIIPWDRRDVTERVVPQKIMPTEPGFFTAEEMTRLLQAACREPSSHHFILTTLILGGFVGMRCQEIMRLSWSDILLDHKCVRVSQLITKTGRRRIATLPDNAVAWLHRVGTKTGRVVPESIVQNFHRETNRVAERAGVVWKPNGLRHSYVTYSMALARNAWEVSEQVGNSPDVLQAHYKGLVLPSEANEWFALTPEEVVL